MKANRITENRILMVLKIMGLVLVTFSFLTTFWGIAKADEGKYMFVAEANKGVVLHEKCEGKFTQDASSIHGYLNQPYSDSYTFGKCN